MPSPLPHSTSLSAPYYSIFPPTLPASHIHFKHTLAVIQSATASRPRPGWRPRRKSAASSRSEGARLTIASSFMRRKASHAIARIRPLHLTLKTEAISIAASSRAASIHEAFNSRSPQGNPTGWKKPCFNFQKGRCFHGQSCSFSHNVEQNSERGESYSRRACSEFDIRGSECQWWSPRSIQWLPRKRRQPSEDSSLSLFRGRKVLSRIRVHFLS
jgi:hypothetical protein